MASFDLNNNTDELGHGLISSDAIATPTELVIVPAGKKYKPLRMRFTNDDNGPNPILVKVYKYTAAPAIAANLVFEKYVDPNDSFPESFALNMDAGSILGFTAVTINKITALINGLTFNV
jgi:hypothetical protein